MNNNIRNLTLFIILLLAAVLRFYGFYDFSLTNDELSAIYRTDYQGFFELIQKGVIATDPHPAGVQVFLFYWIKLFGNSVFWVRLPFIISSIVAVYFIYRIGKNWFGEAAGMFSAAYFTTSEFAITYGQIARPYTLGLTFCILLVYFWTKIVKSETSKPWQGFGYVLFAAACCYTHYFSGLFAVVVSISGFVVLKVNRWRNFFLLNVLVVILFIPHLPITFHQLETGGLSGWLPKPEFDFVWEHLRYVLNDSIFFVALVILLVVFAFFKFGINKSDLKYRWISFIWFSFPIVLGYIYSIYHETVLMHRVLLFTFPFFIFFIFSFVNEISSKTTVLVMVLMMIGIGTYSTVIENKFYKVAHFEDFEILAEKIVEWNEKYGKEKITKTINLNSPKYVEYYLDRAGEKASFKIDQIIHPKQIAELLHVVEASDSYYFVNGWACIFHPWEIEEIIRLKYPYIEDSVSVFNSAISLYSKNPNFKRNAVYDLLEKFDSEAGIWEYNHINMDTAFYRTPPSSYKILEHEEFSLSLKIPKENNLKLRGKVLSLSLMANADTTNAGLWIVHVKGGDADLAWHSMPVKDFIDPREAWSPFFMSVQIPEDLKKEDEILIYYWNNSKGSAHFDDIRVLSYDN